MNAVQEKNHAASEIRVLETRISQAEDDIAYRRNQLDNLLDELKQLKTQAGDSK